MKNKVVLLFIPIFILSACGSPAVQAPPPASPTIPPAVFTETPLPTTTPVCISLEPSQSDIDRARTYARKALDITLWEESFTTQSGRVSVTWQNVPLSAVIFIEAVIFPCGYEEPDLNKYFSDGNWAAVFQNYDDYTLVDDCRIESGVRLYQFKASSQGYEYNIRYWAENDTATRLLTTMITFPVGYEADFDDYSIRIFPELPNCS